MLWMFLIGLGLGIALRYLPYTGEAVRWVEGAVQAVRGR